jgi:hypothetical protein
MIIIATKTRRHKGTYICEIEKGVEKGVRRKKCCFQIGKNFCGAFYKKRLAEGIAVALPLRLSIFFIKTFEI